METEVQVQQRLLYYRLIAVWVVFESMLGGIIHGLRLPVSGLIVGSSAIVCISLIAWHVPEKGALLKATIIVAVCKLLLSPHAPLPAYLAVFFQGVMGELIFRHRKYFKTACILFALLALFESAVQRILLMTFVYGRSFWSVVDEFFTKLTGVTGNYSLYFLSGYILIHLAAGWMVGNFAANLPRRILSWDRFLFTKKENEQEPSASFKKKKSWNIYLLAWLFLLVVLLQSYMGWGKPLVVSGGPLTILVRSAFLLLSWHFFIAPLLKNLLARWLNKKQQQFHEEINAVLSLLPSTTSIVRRSWSSASIEGRRNRISRFCRTVIVNTLKNG